MYDERAVLSSSVTAVNCGATNTMSVLFFTDEVVYRIFIPINVNHIKLFERQGM